MTERFWIGFSDTTSLPKEKQSFGQQAIDFVQKSPITRAFLVFHDDQRNCPVAYLVDDNNYIRRSLDAVTDETECYFYEVSTCRADRLHKICNAEMNNLSFAKPVKNKTEERLNRFISWQNHGGISVSLVQPYHIFMCLSGVSKILKCCRTANLELFPKWFDYPMWPDTLKAFIDSDPETFKPRKVIRSIVSL